MKIEDGSPERVLADALCNVLSGLSLVSGSESGMVTFHNRYLGIEGENGVACAKCQELALRVMEEEKRIKREVAARERFAPRENWCYGCKEVLPPEVEIVYDDYTGSPWHRVPEEQARERQVVNGEEIPVCGNVHRRRVK